MPKQLNLEKHVSEARKYSSRSEFVRLSPTSYHMLWRKGMLDEACAHMEISPLYVRPKWTVQSAFDEASRYGSRSEFKRKCSGAYCFALSKGVLDQACSHMRDGAKFWHVFEMMAVAVKYESLKEFREHESAAYNYAKRFGLTDLVASRVARRRAWTKESVMAEASGHVSRSAFHLLAPGAYKHAIENGYLDDACAHMQSGGNGFSAEKPASLYIARISSKCGLELFKVGITNRAPSFRIAGLGVPVGWSACLLEVVSFASGRDARIAEKRLHRKLSSYRYGGPSVLKNGNTELFTINPLET